MANINVLVVDDIKKNRYALEQILEGESYNIIEAASGKAALEILLKETVHIILLDIQMPDIDGFEVAAFIRDNPKTKSIPIIFVTAANKTDHMDLEGYQSGAIDIIYKPINQVILKQKVKILVEFIRIQHDLEEKINELTLLNEENQKMQQHIERLASIDYLTQTMNRRILDESFERYIKSAKRNKTPLSVLMIDLDNFKAYNDNYGHLKGDEALKTVASVLKNTVKRPLDTVGRYGGEEFMIILPETDKDGAQKVSKMILKHVEDKQIKHAKNSKMTYLTVSIGVASTIPSEETTPKEIIDLADKQLYKAKEAGRNCFK